VRVAAIAVAMLAASVAHAELDRAVVPRAVLLRIQGHAGPPKDGDRNIAHLTWRRGDTTIHFTVDELWVLSGELASTDVLHEVEPYTPSMTISGPAEVLDRLATATSDEPLEITGYYRRGVRLLMLSGVEPAKKR
jgi:hypothetical protein